jgi:peptidoglycan hydrolase-like protein with peptidoglycan-binding domain
MPRLLVAVLIFVIAAPAFAQAPAAPSFVQPLAPSALRVVQERLHTAGLYNGAITGEWNEESQNALQRFQENRQLQVTGQLNAATASALGLSPQQLLGIGAPEQAQQPRPIRLGADAMRNVQGRLRDLGFYRGAVDGLWGPATQAAITALQRSHNLEATGRLDPATVSAMGLDPYDPAKPMP